MEVTSTTAAGAAGTARTSASAASIDYNSFLKLLIAEMKNQDPTNPIDSSDYVAQFAAFSNVEQALATNARLDALLTSSALAQADGVIGRTATSADGALSGKIASIRITSGAPVALLEGGRELVLGAGVTIS